MSKPAENRAFFRTGFDLKSLRDTATGGVLRAGAGGYSLCGLAGLQSRGWLLVRVCGVLITWLGVDVRWGARLWGGR